MTQKERGETRTGRHFLNAGRLSESAGERMSEAENFLLPEQVVWGLVGAKVRMLRPTNCANAPDALFWRFISIANGDGDFKRDFWQNWRLVAPCNLTGMITILAAQ